MRQLSAIDAAFLYAETAEVPMHVGSIAIFKLPDDYRGDFYEAFKKNLAERLHLAPILTCKLANAPFDLDHPSWVEDEQFDINRHVFRGSLATPGDRAAAERIAGWMHAKLLNRARPLWEFYVFEGLPDNEIAVYMKVHHAAIDGGAGMALTQMIYDTTPEPREVAPPAAEPAPAPQPDEGPPDIGKALFDSYVHLWQQPLKMWAGLPNLMKALPDMLAKAADPRTLGDLMTSATPKTPLNKAISSERSFAAVSLSLGRAKAVAKKAGGKLNDVVLAICSGVLRRYLIDQAALPSQSLTAFVPISLRKPGDSEASNQVMGMITTLATTIEDPKTRLATIVTESAKSKEMINPFKELMPFYNTSSYLGAPIGAQVLSMLYSRSNLANVLTPAANVVVSNVPGSPVSLYACGAELLHIYPVSIASHGLALNITVQSYRDELDFGLIAGANVLPNVRQLADLLPQELETLERAYGTAEVVPADAIA